MTSPPCKVRCAPPGTNDPIVKGTIIFRRYCDLTQLEFRKNFELNSGFDGICENLVGWDKTIEQVQTVLARRLTTLRCGKRCVNA